MADTPFSDLAFCALDVETSGLSPQRDRVVELAMVRFDAAGQVGAEIHTLVDPQGSVGPTEIHGIEQGDVREAPRWDDLVPAVAQLLDGAVVVAHNASFDMGFLEAEMARAGWSLPPLPYICSMRLRRQIGLPAPSAHMLMWACWQQGLAIESAHAAVCDARATGALLSQYVQFAVECGQGCLGDLCGKGVAADSWAYPPVPTSLSSTATVSLQQRDGVSPTAASLHRETGAEDSAVQGYSSALATAAADFQIDPGEVEVLHQVIVELGLSAAQVRAAHVAHVQHALDQRLDDGVLTWAEKQEVRAFARLLGLPDRVMAELLARVAGQIEERPVADTAGSGLRVCFTGEFVSLPLTRDEVSELAQDAGMEVLPRVTKKLDLLVCAEPHSGTSKLQKANDYGTVIINQPTFLALAGVEPSHAGVVSGVLEQIEARRQRDDALARGKKETAAQRNRDRAAARRAAPPGEAGAQTLWCEAGSHEWTRPAQRGRPPKVCPEHFHG